MRIERTAWIIFGVAGLALLMAIGVYARYRVRLELTPDHVEMCRSAPVEVDVAWRARGAKSISILVYQIGETPKVWVPSAGWKGKARTGAWGSDGMTVMLVDSEGRTLARKTVEAVPCRR